MNVILRHGSLCAFLPPSVRRNSCSVHRTSVRSSALWCHVLHCAWAGRRWLGRAVLMGVGSTVLTRVRRSQYQREAFAG
eukprot:9478167-Pyramimonas_sp.AAC.2